LKHAQTCLYYEQAAWLPKVKTEMCRNKIIPGT